MELTFATVVDEVRQLSSDEKRELVEIIELDLNEEWRREVLVDGAEAKRAFEAGELKVYSDMDEMLADLNG